MWAAEISSLNLLSSCFPSSSLCVKSLAITRRKSKERERMIKSFYFLNRREMCLHSVDRDHSSDFHLFSHHLEISWQLKIYCSNEMRSFRTLIMIILNCSTLTQWRRLGWCIMMKSRENKNKWMILKLLHDDDVCYNVKNKWLFISQ